MDLKSFKNYQLYRGKPLLGVDFGSKAIGLATFVPGRDPYPLAYGNIAVKDLPWTEQELLTIISRESIHAVIFGLPLLADGGEGEMAKKVRLFAHGIGKQAKAPILFQDEYLSSRSAQERVESLGQWGLSSPSEQIHAESAKIILEDFIRSKGAL